MEQWVIDNLKKYQEMYKHHNQKDSALRSCALTMVKILNGLSEMDCTQFHEYERKMLWRAMELFSEQCIDQMYIAYECGNVLKKKEYIEDIEASISAMAEVYRDVMGGVSDAERQMFQSLSVDMKMYDLSPKLCAFYSSILDRVVEMFKDGGMEYAFVLHPMLRSTTEAKVLLEKREQSGKVVIVYLSESLMEKFDSTSICLIHEAFHVLTKSERNRKERMVSFALQMMEHTQRLVFDGVSFGAEDKKIKEELTKRWLGGLKQWIVQVRKEDKDDKSFYGKRAEEEVNNRLMKCLEEINEKLEDTVKEFANKWFIYTDYEAFQKNAEATQYIIKQIRSNVFQIASEGKIQKMSNEIMLLYREAYADIACILLLEIDKECYDKAFTDSIRFRYNVPYEDSIRELRESLVAEIVSKHISLERRGSWEQCMAQSEPESQKGEQTQQFSEENSGQIGEDHVNMGLNQFIRGFFTRYLDKCAYEFSDRLRGINDIEVFRERMREVVTGENQQLLGDILGGSFFDTGRPTV